jgi:hypothetical protein
MIASEDRPHLRRSQYYREWQLTPESTDFSAPTLGPVQRRKQHCGFPGADGLAHLLKPGSGKTRPARKTNRVTTTLHQQSLDAIRKPWRQS